MNVRLTDKSVALVTSTAVCAGVLLWLALTAVSAQAQTPEPIHDSAYADVPQDAWYREPVVSLEAQGIFEGTDCDEGFCPGEPLERWQMAVWVVRILDGQEPALIDESRFADVDNHADWIHFIDRLADLGVTVGCKSEPLRYCPDSAVTRSQMAAFLYRAFDLPDAENPAGFTDVPEDSWAFNSINALAASGITVGCKSEPFSYCPSSSVTKAQMATFLYRALERQAAQEQTTEEPDDGVEETPSEVNDNPNNIPGYDPDVFYTEENELSRFVKHEIVDKHAEENPWLLEVWNNTNRSDFEYVIVDDLQGFSHGGTGTVQGTASNHRIQLLSRVFSGSVAETMLVMFHEMAHHFTMQANLARPAPVAIGYLYLDIVPGRDHPYPCSGADELYAKVAENLVPIEGRDVPRSLCGSAMSEAIEVVKSAFAGEIPQWFYDTFQEADGTLDYEAIWTAILDIDNGFGGSFSFVRTIVAIQLENEFGGYCSKRNAYSALFLHSQLVQPWRDGGCPNN